MPHLMLSDAELYYQTHGEGPAVVFAHGVGSNHAGWFQQVAAFAKFYRVVTFDHRGFGNSTDPGRKGRSAFIEDLQALLDHLAIERAALVAQSMGGGTCAGFAARFPRRVGALVLADTVQGLEEVVGNRELLSQARAATDGLDQLERVLGEDVRLTNPTMSFLYTQLASFNLTDRRTLTGAFFPLVKPQELTAAQVPTLFIVGKEDRLFPPAAVKALQEQVVGSFYVEISGAGHSAYFERPNEFNDSVLGFLQAVRYHGSDRPDHGNAPGSLVVEGKSGRGC